MQLAVTVQRNANNTPYIPNYSLMEQRTEVRRADDCRVDSGDEYAAGVKVAKNS
jgi:hypothetical protein